MATVPTPYDATSGFKLTAADWDAGVRDVMTWLMTNYPRVHAYSSVGVTCVNGTATAITFDSVIYDTDNMHPGSSSQVVFTTAGLYSVQYMITMPVPASVAYTQFDLNVRLNSGGSSSGGTTIRTQPYSDGTRGGPSAVFAFEKFFNAGDYIEMFVTQASGANRVTSATSLGTKCQARWIATT